jgi:hypothetical protein
MGFFDRPNYVAPVDPGTRQEYLAANPDAWAGNGTDYMSAIRQYYGENPGTLEDYLIGKEENGPDPFTARQDATNEYNARLSNYQRGQAALAAQTPQKGQSYTKEQIAQMTGSPVNNSNTYQGIPYATADNPFADPAEQGWGAVNQFLVNPDGTYRVANLGGLNPEVRVNEPNKGSWTDYMDAAITLATIAGTAYVAPQAIGAAFAPAAGVGADAYMASAGLNPGTFGGAAFTMPGLAETASYVSPTDYMSQSGLDAGTFNKFTPTNPLTDYMGQAGLDAGKFSGANFQMPTGLTGAEALKYANQARQALGVGSTLAKLVGGGNTTAGGAGGTSQQQIAQYLRGLQAPAQAGPVPYQIKMNENPFTFNIPGQTRATEGMYDVSGVNPMANALRKA